MTSIQDLTEQISSEALADLTRLVNTNSFSGNPDGLVRAGDLIQSIAKDKGILLEKQFFSEAPDSPFHLVADYADNQPFIGLIGHFDTVHPPDSPFKTLEDKGDTLVGPGVQDMKAGIITAIYGLYLAKQAMGVDSLPVKIIFNADEETGSQNSRPLIEKMMAGAKAALVFEGRGIDNALVTSRKGIMTGEMQVTGKAAHAGESPDKGASAIMEAIEKIQALDSLKDLDRGIIVTTGVISGGRVANQIPDFCSSSIDVRFTTIAQEDEVRKAIAEIMDRVHVQGCTTTYTLKTVRPPFESSPGIQALWQEYATIAESMGLTLSHRHGGGGSDANFTAAMGIPSIDGIGAAGRFPHTNREYIEKASFFKAIQAFAMVATKLVTPINP